MASGTSSFNPDQIKLSESKLDQATQSIHQRVLAFVGECQTFGKWGHEDGPAQFKSSYSTELSTLCSKLFDAETSNIKLGSSMKQIREDANDADLEATMRAGQIAAEQAITTPPSTTTTQGPTGI